MKAICRREFLQLCGTVSGGLLGTGILRPFQSIAKDKSFQHGPYDQGKWIPSCCSMCGGQTGILCQVVDGRVVRIKPNNHNPNGFTNISDDFFANAAKEGAVICPKGNAGIMALYDPDRLRQPLRRTNPQKGIGVDPRWKVIPWEQACSEIVTQLNALREAGDAHKLL